MPDNEWIDAQEICTWYHAELSFVKSLQESGLIMIAATHETELIHRDELLKLEKMVRLHYDMDINLEGIETVTHLLQKIAGLQQQIVQLKNRLSIYEDNR
jgi:chaperone modulatory protein CbpM